MEILWFPMVFRPFTLRSPHRHGVAWQVPSPHVADLGHRWIDPWKTHEKHGKNPYVRENGWFLVTISLYPLNRGERGFYQEHLMVVQPTNIDAFMVDTHTMRYNGEILLIWRDILRLLPINQWILQEHILYNWWLTYPSEKYESQLGL